MKRKAREFIAVRLDVDLPLKTDQLREAIGVLEGVLGIFKSALAAKPVEGAAPDPPNPEP